MSNALHFTDTGIWFPHFNLLFKFIRRIYTFISIWDCFPYYILPLKHSASVPYREVFVLGNHCRLLIRRL